MATQKATEPFITIQEREVHISCLKPPLGVSISGPSVVLPNTGFTLSGNVVDSANASEPTTWQWLCIAASGAPCFAGRNVPDASSSVFIITPGMILPDEYNVKARSIAIPHACCLKPPLSCCLLDHPFGTNAGRKEKESNKSSWLKFNLALRRAKYRVSFVQVLLRGQSGARTAEGVHNLRVLDLEQQHVPKGRLKRACTSGIHCAHVQGAPVDATAPVTLQVSCLQRRRRPACLHFAPLRPIRLFELAHLLPEASRCGTPGGSRGRRGPARRLLLLDVECRGIALAKFRARKPHRPGLPSHSPRRPTGSHLVHRQRDHEPSLQSRPSSHAAYGNLCPCRPYRPSRRDPGTSKLLHLRRV